MSSTIAGDEEEALSNTPGAPSSPAHSPGDLAAGREDPAARSPPRPPPLSQSESPTPHDVSKAKSILIHRATSTEAVIEEASR